MFKFKKKEINNPKHIAFICDGNRRWAEKRGLAPLLGHKAGIANFETLADWFIERGITTLTFFLFSTENWNRTDEEIDFLMDLFYKEMKKNLQNALKKDIRYRVIGSRDRLPKKLADICDELEEKSAEGTNGTIAFALNYGGQAEIVNAVNNVIKSGTDSVDIESFESFMDTGDLLPIDLMVRTSNEHRISNFLLWKLAYAELLFMKQHWPDLVRSKKLWKHILKQFTKRNRRFGGGKKKNYSGNNGK